MKQFRILSMLMIVLISSLSFVSCGDDDDETSGDFSASIAGVYTGKLKVGTNVTADAYVVTVTKVTSTQITVVKITMLLKKAINTFFQAKAHLVST